MKFIQLLTLVALLTPVGTVWADPSEDIKTQKFYGKITAQNTKDKTITVTNKRRKLVSEFSLNKNTIVRHRKKPMNQQDLAIGQNLIIWYINKGDTKIAHKITVRATSKKKPTKT